MLNKRIIARIDVNNGQLVKGKYLEGLRKLGNPKTYIDRYYNDLIDEIIILDAVASLYGRNSNYSFLKEVCKEFHIPITIGGGIKTMKDIELAFKSGSDKVALNSAIVNDLGFLNKAVEYFGSQAIVGSIVTRRHRYSWEIFIDNAKHRIRQNPFEWSKILVDNGVGELMITSIDFEGRMLGFDFELLRGINDLNLRVPFTVSGGIATKQHISKIFSNSNCSGVIIASALHYNKVSVNEIKHGLKSDKLIFRV